MNSEYIQNALTKAGLPIPEGSLLHARYHTRTDDWYVQTDQGWFWWDPLKKRWMKSINPTPGAR